MSVELDHTLSFHNTNSNFSVPSKASSLPLRIAIEQCPSIPPRICRQLHCKTFAVAVVHTSVLKSQVSYSCYQDGDHNSDVLVRGSDTFSPRYHRCVDVVLTYL